MGGVVYEGEQRLHMGMSRDAGWARLVAYIGRRGCGGPEGKYACEWMRECVFARHLVPWDEEPR